MADHAALRRAGRARRVDVGEEVVLGDRALGIGEGRRVRPRRTRGPVRRDRRESSTVSTCSSAGARRGRRRSSRVWSSSSTSTPTDSEWARTYAQSVGEVRVHRRRHSPDEREREVELRPLDARPDEDAERVSLLDAEREQAVGEIVDATSRVGPRHAPASRPPARRGTEASCGEPQRASPGRSRAGCVRSRARGRVEALREDVHGPKSRREGRRAAKSAGPPRLSDECERPGTARSASGWSASPSAWRRRRSRLPVSRMSRFACSIASARRRSSRSAGARFTSTSRPGRDRPRLGGVEGRVRDRRGRAISRRSTATRPRARSTSRASCRGRGRPDLLRPHVLPRPGDGDRRSAGPYVLLLQAMRETGPLRSAASCSPARRSSA